MNLRLSTLLATLSVLLGPIHADDALPHLRQQGVATQLIVHGEPFLIRGGELGNSTGEPDYLRQYWPKLKALNLNTVVAPIYWDLTEPEEGKFDFSTLDGLLKDAREHDMHLVLLWFGVWKNSMSSYIGRHAVFPNAEPEQNQMHVMLTRILQQPVESRKVEFTFLGFRQVPIDRSNHGVEIQCF